MNKTLTINLSGLVFNIDENAYETLRNYLDKLKRRFTGSSSSEIISDIETRIAEMFQENISAFKNVITLSDVENVITIMGNPEDIAGETSSSNNSSERESYNSTEFSSGPKRFFRNPDDKIIGGVCSGISSYFGFDPIWLRLFFVLLLLTAGTGVLLYIILWIIIPKAKTASEKLEMQGVPFNIRNIEKNIKEDLSDVKENVENIGKEFKSTLNEKRIHNSTNKLIAFITQLVAYIVQAFRVIIGIVVVFISLVVLITLTILLFVGLGIIPISRTDVPIEYISYIMEPSVIWLALIGAFITIAIPVILLFLNGIKLLFQVNLNLKKLGIVMLFIWLGGLGLTIYHGILIGKEYSVESMNRETKIITQSNSKTLVLKANNISNGRFDWYNRGNGSNMAFDGSVISFGNENDVLCNSIRLDVDQSRNDSVYLQIEYKARGRNSRDARDNMKKIVYGYSVQDTTILFDNAFDISTAKKWRAQSINMTLKIPIGKKIMVDESIKDFVNEYYESKLTDENMTSQIWQMTRDGLKCLNCKNDELKVIIPESSDIDTSTKKISDTKEGIKSL